MEITRRRLIASAAAFGLVASRTWAATEAKFEGFVLHSLSDGKLVLPMDFLIARESDLAEAQPILSEAGISGDSYDAPLNVTLLDSGDSRVLFDAGSGADFMPTAGKLTEALAAIEVEPDSITHVVFTHAHPDHIWGVLDDFDEPVFANARHLIGRTEREFWMDPATADQIDPARLSFLAGAQRRIETLGDLLETFEDGDEVLPGITARATPGHTPGHMSFDLGDKAFVTGDALLNAHLAFLRPEIASGSDQNPEMASETRMKLLEYLADSQRTIVGYHLPDGGIGTVTRDATGYQFKKSP